jgi:hypothetical protein
MGYKCSICGEPSSFYLKVGGKIKSYCLEHYKMIKQQRLIKQLKKTGIQHE